MTALPPDLPIKAYDQASVFEPANLLRESRRQKDLPDMAVPSVCLLDPDGDIANHLRSSRQGHRHPGWACYHTDMWVTDVSGTVIGVVGRAVGAPFAVLVAGQLRPLAQPPYFVLIDQALRDEGTSLHYQPAATWSDLPDHLASRLTAALINLEEPVITARSWTTDAPYRETPAAIASATVLGAACVEMEAAALYALAAARGLDIVCLAHITNTMATAGDDFEKGDANGAHASLALAAHVAHLLGVGTTP